MTGSIDQAAQLRRRIAVLEADNQRLREAAEFAVRTLDLCRSPANPLAKAADSARAEKMLRAAVTQE